MDVTNEVSARAATLVGQPSATRSHELPSGADTGGQYLCPGESQPINRALHLARLASHYPRCATCDRRSETGHLSAAQIRHVESATARPVSPRLTAEAFEGVYLNNFGPAQMRKLAESLAAAVWRERSSGEPRPHVVMAHDGRWLTAQLVAAACDGLRYGLCDVSQTEPLTAAATAEATARTGAAAGLLIGNADSESHTVSVKFWGAGGSCWSSPGGLDVVAEMLTAPLPRAGRGYGALRRLELVETYLERFADSFHACRPLRIVLDSRCQPLRAWVDRLSKDSGCEFLPLGDAPATAATTALERGASAAGSRDGATSAAPLGVGASVRQQQAHLGVWIDGDGERCQFYDERGDAMYWSSVLQAVAVHRGINGPIVCPLADDVDRVKCIAPARLTREAICAAMKDHSALLGADVDGRIYFGHDPRAADALAALVAMVSLLSQSDAPASEVVERR